MTERAALAADKDARLDRTDVDAALAVAVRAPSLHNTQPWRWRLDDSGLSLLADRTRQLSVADPDGHSLLISCGAALHLTELGLRAAGWDVGVELFPPADDPDTLAVLRPRSRQAPDSQTLADVEAALRRCSDRRPFSAEPLATNTAEALRTATSTPAAWLDFPRDEQQRVELAVAISWADRTQHRDEAYRAEMRRWLRDPTVHDADDGMPLTAIPHVPEGHPRRTDVPVRDFEVGVSGQELIAQDVDEKPLIAVVLTEGDSARDHLEAGRAMMRLMIAAELAGLGSCPLSQGVDLAAFRTRVQALMGWIGRPQMMLRIGHPSAATERPARTPRRDPADVLDIR